MAYYYLKVSQVESFCYVLASEFFESKSYLMPYFRYHNKDTLIAPLNLVKFHYYKTIFDKAGYLGFAIIKGHPFIDGNKRIGMIVALTFLLVNGYFLDVRKGEILNIALKIAKNELSQKDFCLWLKSNSEKAPKDIVNLVKMTVKSIK